MKGFFVILPVVGVAIAHSTADFCTDGHVKRRLFLDLDNTLYREKVSHIEKQMVANIHDFCQSIGISEARADTLHHEYGSTIEGLCQTTWSELNQPDLLQRLDAFYQHVYRSINVSGLLQSPSVWGSKTGYTHAVHQERIMMRTILASSPFELYVASNSPSWHVSKVLQALGLAGIPWKGWYTPDASPEKERVSYPTKAHPLDFWDGMSETDVPMILVDDSERAIEACKSFMQGIQVNDKTSITHALALAHGWVDPNYKFSQSDYLWAKRIVDLQSINRSVYQRMIEEVDLLLLETQATHLSVVDLGAGALSMLRLLLQGGDELPSLLPTLKSANSLKRVHYYAYESNTELTDAAMEQLEILGFELHDCLQWESENGNVEERIFVRSRGDEKILVHLRGWEYQQCVPCQTLPPQLVIGCCFADLLDPMELTSSIIKQFLYHSGTNRDHALVYFPITFRGITQFVPAHPFESTRANVPSDTTAFALYSKALVEGHGHYICPNRLLEAIAAYGGEIIAKGPSDWHIDPKRHSYMWETMLFFFGTVAAPRLQQLGWDAADWLQRARTHAKSIQASNVDILCRLGEWTAFSCREDFDDGSIATSYEEVEFRGPMRVSSVGKRRRQTLEPEEVRVKGIASLISSGTELKIFQGDFDDAALDLNIKGMKEERLAYPLSYGYCHVGRVVECGSDVKDANSLIGKLVFSFSPHASEVYVHRNAVQIVPAGIEPYDAIFMPNVETALSLVHDAQPRLGECIVIFGQGVVGLLVTAILNLTLPRLELSQRTPGFLTTVDALPDRLLSSAQMGSPEAVFPGNIDILRRYDVAIEVSGNGKALQNAIDVTRDGGRIILGSWYGSHAINLHLGMDFHRSHKIIRASQVSELPADMRMTWDKARRFRLAWNLVAALKPSRLLSRTVELSQAQEAYESLDNGHDIAIAFKY